MHSLSLSFYITETSFEFDTSDSKIVTSQDKNLYDSFLLGKGVFLLKLSFQTGIMGTPSVAFLKHMADIFLNKVVSSVKINYDEIEESDLSDDEMTCVQNFLPFIVGVEHVDKDWINSHYHLYTASLFQEYESSGKNLRAFLLNKGFNIVIPSKVYFHLVESPNSDYPFAFLATYTTKVNGKITHVPLKNALREFQNNSTDLSVLISSITQASSTSLFVESHLDNGEIFYPLKLDEKEAYRFLQETEIFEKCGIVCRVPKWHNEKSISIGLDFDEILQFSGQFFSQSKINAFTPHLIYHGIEITIEEVKYLLAQNEGLHLIKNRWVELNHNDLLTLLKEYNSFSQSGSTLLDILRNKSGIGQRSNDSIVNVVISHEDWINKLLDRQLQENNNCEVPYIFQGVLRHYQKDGYKWLWGMSCLGFGVCLADDMGLGKTIEVLAFLEKLRLSNTNAHALIIVPATLVSNWESEIKKFDSAINYFILRGNNEPTNGLYKAFATITTYQIALRSTYISSVNWDVIILDEAQAIKNHYTSQAKKIKSLKSTFRIAMTGTPIENNALELWSIFDFLNPGLLGSREEFKRYYGSSDNPFIGIKKMIRPFILRRVKTDKSIIDDLPEKNEIDVTINLTKEQIVLYRKVVSDMNETISASKEKEKILIISALIKLKQVCNHPSQYYGSPTYNLSSSGKFITLKEICETIYAKREKVLVFTQFKEIIPALDGLLATVFKTRGTTIDGDTSMTERKARVDGFQEGQFPYMVLSLKTAGVGLNLTAAQNVIHFDRWWNPAVENQATDRVYRIGQKNNVMVYRFVAANTIEEIINKMLKAKQELADDIINNMETSIFSKLSVEEIMNAARYGGINEEI